jgi:hypothetical protein
MNYKENSVPEGYVCSVCGATGCKLWRQYQTFLDHIQLMCATCASKNQDEYVADIDDNGRRSSKHSCSADGRTDTIGWLVPAIPDEEEESYWGYTSVPMEGVAWWRQLPTLAGTE